MRHTFEVRWRPNDQSVGRDFDDHGQGFLTTCVEEHLWYLVPGAHYQRWKDRGVHPDPYVYEAMSATSDHITLGVRKMGQSRQAIRAMAAHTHTVTQ